MIRSIITGSGHYIPKNIVKNEDFLNKTFYLENGEVNTLPSNVVIEKFEQITEIRERRYLDADMVNSDMAAIAGKNAIENAGINPEELDYVMVAHNYGDIDAENGQVDAMPNLAARVKHKIGIKNNRCKSYDVYFGCPGWVEAMIMANQYIIAGIAKKILVIGSETLGRAVDPYDRNSMIFADGAGAVVLEAKDLEDKVGFLGYFTISDNQEELEYINNGKSVNSNYTKSISMIQMKGRKVYEYALKKVPAVIKKTIDDAGYHIKDVDMVFLHQANAKMDHAMVERLFKLYDIPITEIPENVAPMTVQFLGNSSVATVPTMYHMVLNNELPGYSLKKGALVVFASVGAGMNINAILYKHPS